MDYLDTVVEKSRPTMYDDIFRLYVKIFRRTEHNTLYIHSTELPLHLDRSYEHWAGVRAFMS